MMDKQQALGVLGITDSGNQEKQKQAFHTKRAQAETLLAKAPTDALKDKYQTSIEQLNQAAEVLGLTAPEKRASAAPQAANLSSLSQTKIADLPNARARHSQFEDQTKAELGLQPGQVLANRYEIREQIGAGGMGAVYQAFDNNTQKDIALKVMLPSLLKNERARERFIDEARISQQLSHPNIVNVFDVQQDGDFCFLIMELLQGQDLRQVMENQKLARQPFAVEDVQDLMQALSEGLAYAHKHTVHRDIKPENIWLCEDGGVKIMDFGIARVQSSSQRTQTGAAMGTAYYMAPEQLKGMSDIDGRADQYALAVMAYEMLTGEVPAGMIESVRDHRKDVPKAMAEAIHQGLASRPENRFEDITVFAQALQQSGGGMSFPGFDVQKLAVPAAIVVGVLLLGGLLWTGAIDFKNLLPMSQEEIAQRKAVGNKLIGEIKNYQRRLDGGRRQLNSDIRDAERNGSKGLAALAHWKKLTDNYLFNGSQLIELEGDFTAGEALLRDKSLELAEQTLRRTRDGYKALWENFSAAEELYSAADDTASIRDFWYKQQKAYRLGEPAAVLKAEGSEQAANSSQRRGDFVSTLDHWQDAERHWQTAYKAVSGEVARIDQQREDTAAAKVAAAKVAAAKVAAAKAVAAKVAAAKDAAAKAAVAQAIQKKVINSVIKSLVTIPSGSFQMGGSYRISDENPVHHVSVSAFKMSQTEVTFAQWDACVQAGGCSHRPDDAGWGRDKRPVTSISYLHITQQFIPWLNKGTSKHFRLPSEAEWEYAARAGSTSKYSWGNSINCSQARYGYRSNECGKPKSTVPVGSFSPNQFGLYDMHGNVWEWTQDCWNESYSGAPSNGRAWQRGDCKKRVMRGGAWANGSGVLRSGNRKQGSVQHRDIQYGFRLVQDL
jgi:formylglycine-generating enzyme required for sulfatase activity/serine/threonine protein kinase